MLLLLPNISFLLARMSTGVQLQPPKGMFRVPLTEDERLQTKIYLAHNREVSNRVVAARDKARELVDNGDLKDAEGYFEIIELNMRAEDELTADSYRAEWEFDQGHYAACAKFLRPTIKNEIPLEMVICDCELGQQDQAMRDFALYLDPTQPNADADMIASLPIASDDSLRSIEASAWAVMARTKAIDHNVVSGRVWGLRIAQKAHDLAPDNAYASYLLGCYLIANNQAAKGVDLLHSLDKRLIGHVRADAARVAASGERQIK